MDDLHAAAFACLMCADPDAKVALTQATARRHAAGDLAPDPASPEPVAVPEPGRPVRPRLVSPREVASRGLGTAEGRAALVHAVAHIEFNAINLAWDAVYRFRGMPDPFYADWIAVAADEARHFELLRSRLADLGLAYGDLPAHDGLWSMARRTDERCLDRMALVPRVLEARGLDVTPGMIARLRAAGDLATVGILELILREEVGHVAAGSRWFRWCCERDGLDAHATFEDLVLSHGAGAIRPPFNREARHEAGFSAAEMAGLERLAGLPRIPVAPQDGSPTGENGPPMD
jgi:uncharacterized ferritin-like protein (DUF455 family)